MSEFATNIQTVLGKGPSSFSEAARIATIQQSAEIVTADTDEDKDTIKTLNTSVSQVFYMLMFKGLRGQEFILFHAKKQREKLKAWFPTAILGSPLCPAESAKNLGVWFDSDFSLSKHVQSVCNSCYIQLHDFRLLGSFLCPGHTVARPLRFNWRI